MLHEALWRSNLDLARSCLAHPFVEGLGAGTLEAPVFCRYVAQDAFFLQAFLKAYALALARSGDLETIATFHHLIGGVLQELKLHRDYAAKLGLDFGRVAPNAACRSYTDFLLRTAWHESLGDTVAAMTPCMRLYAYLGRELAGRHSEQQHPYRRWIDAYNAEDFRELTGRLERLLDQHGTDTLQLRDCYHYALQCELDFFSEL